MTGGSSDECMPLHTPWTLYYFKFQQSSANQDWKSGVQQVLTVKTIQEFWAMMQHIKKPSELINGCDYIIFRESIQPEWEDKTNANGGVWELKLESNKKQLDKFWMELLMLMLGEMLGEKYCEYICGLYVNIRAKGHRVRVWTKDAADQEAQMVVAHKIQNTFLNYLGESPAPALQFTSHCKQINYNCPGMKEATEGK